MRSQVTVTWGENASYRFDLDAVPPMPNDQARAWLDSQFTAFECEPIRLTGKAQPPAGTDAMATLGSGKEAIVALHLPATKAAAAGTGDRNRPPVKQFRPRAAWRTTAV